MTKLTVAVVVGVVFGLSFEVNAQDYDFDSLNDGGGASSTKTERVKGIASTSKNALQRQHEQRSNEEAAERRAELKANQDAALRSGNIKYITSKSDQWGTTWSALCDEGGWANVNVAFDHPNVYSWSGGGYPGCKGGADAGIGIERSLRKACRGGHD